MNIQAAFAVFLLCFAEGFCVTCANSSQVGETKKLEVSALAPAVICIQLNSSAELEPIRVSVESENASIRHPLLVTMRQPLGVASLTVPYVESGFAYSSFERTLCPQLNIDDSGPGTLYIDISTTEPDPVTVTVHTEYVTPFRLQLNTPVQLEASPSGPAYLLYEFENPPTEPRVRVDFQSEDNSSEICAIASIQTAYCPVVELLDNPDHRGRYQTMRAQASINIKENFTEPYFGYFYIVLSVLPNDGVDGSCVSVKQGLGNELILFNTLANNFNPTAYSGPDRTKRVTITVRPVNPDLGVALAVPTVIYLLFIVVVAIFLAVTLFWKKKIRGPSAYSVDNKGTANGQEMSPVKDSKESNGKPSNGTSQNDQPANCPEDKKCEKFQVKVMMSELGHIDETHTLQKEYFHYVVYLLVIIMFYSIPAYQLVVTYQRLLVNSGNEDICYYNSRCASPLDIYSGFAVSAFNNLISNIGYVILGVLYIGVAYLRKRRYKKQQDYNVDCEQQERQGVPQTFGIYYAIGLVMIAQAFMSVAYHLCPSTTNYQFDATFMYVMAVLGMFKILTSRSPDLDPSLHRHALFLMTIIAVVVLGGLWFKYLAFKIVFIILYVVTTVYYSVEVYYRWQIKLNPQSVKKLFLMYKAKGLCPPQHIPKFIVLWIVLIINFVIAGGIFLADSTNTDFARYFLLIILVNFLIYLVYYLITKLCYKECCSLPVLKLLLYVFLAVGCWVASIWFFTRNVTDTSVSPALSRDRNMECILFGFYDSHDLWHFMSSFALFFSFSILLTLDDGLYRKPRKEINIF